jgi:molecular chaperone GrpE
MSNTKEISQEVLKKELETLENNLSNSSNPEVILSKFLDNLNSIISSDDDSQEFILKSLTDYVYPNISDLYDNLLSKLYKEVKESDEEAITILDKLKEKNVILSSYFRVNISQLYIHLSNVEVQLAENSEDDALEYWNRIINNYGELIESVPQVQTHINKFIKDNPILNKNTETKMSETIEQVNVKDSEEYKELEKKHQMLYAEFDNFRKRTAKEKETLRKGANEKLILDLLETLDNFDSASKTQGGLSKGIELTYNVLLKTLEKHGVQGIMVDGEKVDADIMHPISQISVEDDNKKGTVVETFSKGYKLNDKIIRFPKVVIGK